MYDSLLDKTISMIYGSPMYRNYIKIKRRKVFNALLREEDGIFIGRYVRPLRKEKEKICLGCEHPIITNGKKYCVPCKVTLIKEGIKNKTPYWKIASKVGITEQSLKIYIYSRKVG